MMRRFLPAAAALALLAFQAQAQTTDQSAPAAPAAPAPAPATPPAATGTPMMQKPMAHQMSHRMSLQQRFDAANTSHDGKLTKDQAAAANWPYVLNNFSAIDKDNKGYVTTSDIRAFARARHGQMHAAGGGSMGHHESLQQRFDAANTSHDGKLTKDQAAAAKWPWVDRNFDAMDKDHKGYVTVEDLHNFSHMRHAQMHATPAAAQPQTPPAQSAPAPAAPAPAAPAAPTTQPTQ
jgi:hypothetical protein